MRGCGWTIEGTEWEESESVGSYDEDDDYWWDDYYNEDAREDQSDVFDIDSIGRLSLLWMAV